MTKFRIGDKFDITFEVVSNETVKDANGCTWIFPLKDNIPKSNIVRAAPSIEVGQIWRERVCNERVCKLNTKVLFVDSVSVLHELVLDKARKIIDPKTFVARYELKL